jgi:hypothetical protein
MPNNTKKIIEALSNPDWEWRTINGISEESKLDPREVRSRIKSLIRQGQVIESTVPDVNGRALYSLIADVRGDKAGLSYVTSLIAQIRWQIAVLGLLVLLWLLLLVWLFVGLLKRGGAEQISSETLLFTLLGLLFVPVVLSYLPVVQGFKVFGMEVKLQQQMQDVNEDRMRKLLFDLIDQRSLTDAGKKALEEWRKKLEKR